MPSVFCCLFGHDECVFMVNHIHHRMLTPGAQQCAHMRFMCFFLRWVGFTFGGSAVHPKMIYAKELKKVDIIFYTVRCFIKINVEDMCPGVLNLSHIFT